MQVYKVKFWYNYFFDQWEAHDENLKRFPSRWGFMIVDGEYIPAKISAHKCSWMGKDLLPLEFTDEVPLLPTDRNEAFKFLLGAVRVTKECYWVDIEYKGHPIQFLKDVTSLREYAKQAVLD